MVYHSYFWGNTVNCKTITDQADGQNADTLAGKKWVCAVVCVLYVHRVK